MCRLTITENSVTFQLDAAPRQDIINCLIGAAVAALPTFFESFLRCIQGTPPEGGYTPGDRTRCQ